MSQNPSAGGKKKKNAQTLSLAEFQALSFGEDKDSSSWIDTNPLPSGPVVLPSAPSGSSFPSMSSTSFRSEVFSPVDFSKIPNEPPYTAYIGNLPFDIQKDDLVKSFPRSSIVTIKLVRDKIEDRPKGHGYIEFEDVDSLKFALELNGILELGGRKIRIDISESLGKRSFSGSKSTTYKHHTGSIDISRRSEPISDGSVSSLHSNSFEISRRAEPISDNSFRQRELKHSTVPEITRKTSPIDERREIPEITRRADPIPSEKSKDSVFKPASKSSKFKSTTWSLASAEGSWRS